MKYKVEHLVLGASPHSTLEQVISGYADDGWRLVAVNNGVHYFERDESHGPSGPPRYWGVYDPDLKQWLKNTMGQLYHYPTPAIAAAHLEDFQSAMAHVVDGRGKPWGSRHVVREMVYDGPA